MSYYGYFHERIKRICSITWLCFTCSILHTTWMVNNLIYYFYTKLEVLNIYILYSMAAQINYEVDYQKMNSSSNVKASLNPVHSHEHSSKSPPIATATIIDVR